MSNRKSSSTENISKKSKQTLEKRTELTMELISLLKPHPLLRSFNNITKWQNLVNLNLSNNGIGDLPMELGTLPCLQYLDLSRNNIGISYRYGWLWIMQAEIRNTLLLLDISKNSITELPDYIGKLNALMLLDISHNELRRLPHTIANMRSLEILYASHNYILYLPCEIIFKYKIFLNISMNPCITNQHINKIKKIVFPTLVELSSAILPQDRLELRSILPNVLIEYMDSIRRCLYCNKYGKVVVHVITSWYPTALVSQNNNENDKRNVSKADYCGVFHMLFMHQTRFGVKESYIQSNIITIFQDLIMDALKTWIPSSISFIKSYLDREGNLSEIRVTILYDLVN